MNNILAKKAQIVSRFTSHVICYEPDDPTPTLYWSPEFSIFCDGKGNERNIWSLENRNDVVAMCRLSNVRFVDCSHSAKLRF